MHKCRGERRSLETMVSSLAAEGFKSGRVSIGHCQNEEGAYQLKRLILEKYPDAVVDVHRLKGLCSFYAEMGGILIGFEKSN
jgi:fatty acid-binding protein DegV